VQSVLLLMLTVGVQAVERQKICFNADWQLHIGDLKAPPSSPEKAPLSSPEGDTDVSWRRVTLPYAFNGEEAFRKDIVDLTDTVVWYRKTFKAPLSSPGGDTIVSASETIEAPSGAVGGASAKYFLEFEGVRQGADVWVNGQKVGFSDNGVMAFGFDITPFVKAGENVIAVRCDNSWTYRDRKRDSRYQWNDNNFNANYGGIPKNVWLHVTDKLYQALPLYSNLGTTGVYVYATNFDIPGRKAMICVESQVKNDDNRARAFRLQVVVKDADGQEVARFYGADELLPPGETKLVKAASQVANLHFWSWGYGYLYTVETTLAEAPPTAPEGASIVSPSGDDRGANSSAICSASSACRSAKRMAASHEMAMASSSCCLSVASGSLI
jgi:beta-galactosidase/beta-glucuronidase